MKPQSIFHLFTFGYYAFVCYYDYKLVAGEYLPIKHNYFSKFVWLTLIDLYLQTLYHLIGFFISLTSGRHGIFHFLARAIVGPIGMAVVVLFWALFLFDPNTLLADEIAKKILSIQWYNHSIHTLPLLTVLLDLFVWDHGQPSKDATVKAIGAFAVFYIIDIHYVHHISGFWAYPILGALPLPFRAIFILACILVFYLCFLFLSFVHHPRRCPKKPKEGIGEEKAMIL